MAQAKEPDFEAPVASRKTRLSGDERAAVCRKAFELNEKRTYTNLTPLLKDAVAEALPEERRVSINSARDVQHAWFRDQMAAWARNPPEFAEAAVPAPGPAGGPVDSPPPPPPQPRFDVPPPPPPQPRFDVPPPPPPQPRFDSPAPEPAQPTLAERNAYRDLDVLARSVGQQAEEDEREEWAHLLAYRRQREKDRAVAQQVALLSQAVVALGTSIQALRGELQAIPAAFREGMAGMMRAAEDLRRFRAPAESMPSANGFHPPDAPAPPPALPEKPKVLVIGTDSGHKRGGISAEVLGRAELTFSKADYAYPNYDRFDHIVVTKDTPQLWQQKAREKYPKGKLHFPAGDSHAVGQFIGGLKPPVVRKGTTEPRP